MSNMCRKCGAETTDALQDGLCPFCWHDAPSTLTLDALKDVLATYGVNREERAYLVTVRVIDPRLVGREHAESERFYTVTGAAIEYDGWPQTGRVLLQAVPTEGAE